MNMLIFHLKRIAVERDICFSDTIALEARDLNGPR